MRLFKIFAAGALASLGLAAPAAAQEAVSTTVTVGDGNTRLAYSKSAKNKLRNVGATITGRHFDVTGGQIDPADAIPGELTHSGKIVVQGEGGRTGFKQLRVQLADGAHKLIGTTAGQEITVANLVGGSVARGGLYRTDVNDFGMRLTQLGASTLNRAIGRPAFKPNAYLGQLSLDTKLEEASVAASGATTIQIAAQAAQKLQQAGVSAAPAAPATASAGPGGLPRFAFPVAGGTVKLDQTEANVLHNGALVLSKGGVQLALASPELIIGATPQLTIDLGGARAAAADLDLTGMTLQGTDNGLNVAGVVVKLNAPTAALMNQQFQTTVFAGGDVVGTASNALTFR